MSAGARDRAEVVKPLPVWIDADPAYGEPLRDTDDVFALLQAFGSPELDVRGVSIVHGNMRRFDRSVERTRELVRLHAPEQVPPVYPGARGADDLGREAPATRALAATLEEERLSILVLGPLTTVATTLLRRPDLSDRIERVVAVAGRRPGEHLRPNGGLIPRGPLMTFPDMNFELDPEAFRVLLDSPVRVTLVPYEACSKVTLGSGDLKRLEEAGALPRWLSRKARGWLSLWTHLIGIDVFFPFDTLAVGVLASSRLVRCEADFSVTIRHEPRQRNVLLRSRDRTTLVVSHGDTVGRPVEWCLGPEEGFTEDLMISGGVPVEPVDRLATQRPQEPATSPAAIDRRPRDYEVSR